LAISSGTRLVCSGTIIDPTRCHVPKLGTLIPRVSAFVAKGRRLVVGVRRVVPVLGGVIPSARLVTRRVNRLVSQLRHIRPSPMMTRFTSATQPARRILIGDLAL
jgi:hypothetical protein